MTVYLVGAGPGDAGLLTLRGAELLERADLVAIDALVSDQIAARIPPHVELVHVGKRAGAHTLAQDEINQLLIAEARKGKTVVRLKGGDPFVFGRGGEEAAELIAAGIQVEIVPGISSAIAGPAYAGIPVTHRKHATSVTLLTGHEADSGSAGIRWEALAGLDGTIVFLMGLSTLPTIVEQLLRHGMGRERPCAVISNATRPNQRTVIGTLQDIEARVAAAAVPGPALIVVGDVVTLRDSINWFESKPLFGRRIVVTRAREQASELSRMLAESGAEVVQIPAIAITTPESWESLDRSIDERFDWVVFTSSNGVRFFFDRLLSRENDARSLEGRKIAAVGRATADELRRYGIRADLVPERFVSTELLPLLAEDQRGIRTAIVRAEEGSDALADELRDRGGEVHLAVAYRTIATGLQLEAIESIDVVTFTSASTVENLLGRLDGESRERLMARAAFASIGPVTTEALRRYGKDPEIVAANATIRDLHDAIVERQKTEDRVRPRN